MAKLLDKILGAIFREWGDDRSLERPSGPARSLDVVLPLEDGTIMTVGKLTVANSRFIFFYSDEFKDSDLPPLPGFPDRTERYESDVLFPFFQVRLPPKTRNDVARVMEERNLKDADIFEVLRVLGRRTVTSPYQFQTSPHHPAFASRGD